MKKQELVDIDITILEAEMTEDRTGDVFKGIINKAGRGMFKLKFRGREVGTYHFNLWVKGLLEKKLVFSGQGVEVKFIPQDPIVTTNMNFSASGFGLTGGSYGKSYSFMIDIKDDDGQPLNCDVHKLQVTVSQGLKKISGSIDHVSTGRYRGSFTPFGTGDMIVCLSYGGDIVFETTVTINIGIDPSKTLIINPLQHTLVGQQNTFTIQARGQTDQDLTTGGEKFDVACSGPAGGVTGLVIRDELNGKYVVRFTLTKIGTYKFFVSLRGADIDGSPMEIEAR